MSGTKRTGGGHPQQGEVAQWEQHAVYATSPFRLPLPSVAFVPL